MRFSVLASGSRGNSTLIEAEGFTLVLDCGISYREFLKRAQGITEMPVAPDVVLVSHFHSDHIKGISRLLDVNSSCTAFSSSKYFLPGNSQAFTFGALEEFPIGPFYVLPLPLPHDDGGSFGFIIRYRDKLLLHATDFGEATSDLRSGLQTANAVVIEANHDLKMLSSCGYPEYLKQRIRSSEGHFSNCQCADLLAASLSRSCKQVVLAHLSEQANHPALALATVQNSITHSLHAAKQSSASPWFSLSDTGTSPALDLCANELQYSGKANIFH